MRQPSITNAKSIDGIQYLRGIAACMVVAHHSRHYFGTAAADFSSIGSRGVDIFFVISGFIMVYITQRFVAAAPRTPQASEFLLKRAIRVIPLYWLALLWASKGLVVHGQADFGLLGDFLFLPRFFPGQTDQIAPWLIPGWTINYEIFFYVAFAASMFCGRYRFLALVAAFSALMLAGALFTFDSAPIRFYTSPVIAEFLLGFLVFYVVSRTHRAPARALLWSVLVVASAGLFIANGFYPDTGVRSFGPCAALIVWSGIHLFQGKSSNILRHIGDASYSIYLFHLFTLPISANWCRWAGWIEPTAQNIAAVICTQVAFATLVGVALHLLLEKPFLRVANALLLGGAFSRRRRSVVIEPTTQLVTMPEQTHSTPSSAAPTTPVAIQR